MAFDEVETADHLAEAPPELRFDRRHGEEALVRCLIRAIAGEASGKRAFGLPAQAVRGEPVGVVSHGDDDVGAASAALSLEQRRQDVDDGEERAAGEVGDLHGRQCRCGVGEQSGPPGVVEVVTGAHAFGTEARHRAVHDRRRERRGADPESIGDAGTKPLQYDVRSRGERRPDP